MCVSIGGSHRADVGAANVVALQGAQRRKYPGAGGAACDRCAGARREGRVEAVDVEGEVGGNVADMIEDRPGDVCGAHLFDLVAVDDANAAVFRSMRANADLDRAAGVDQSFAGRPGDEGARSEEHTSELQSLMRISYA